MSRETKKTVERLNKENPNRQEDIVKHAIATKRKNGSFRTSNPENNAYALLVKLFGENDIERNWDKDARYPFACDFYVKSIDTFIECNFHWTHGGHWFDENNPEDIKRVESFKLKDEQRRSKTGKRKSLYGQCIDTWTCRDKLKHQTAIANNLNYIVFWTYDEVVAWINAQSK